jgi:hypothetical protein
LDARSNRGASRCQRLGNGAFRRLEERLEGRRHSAVHAAVTDLAAGQLMGNGLIETVTVGSG